MTRIARRRRRAVLLLSIAFAIITTPPGLARTLERVRARGTMPCGVVVEQEDFNKTDTHGDLSGFSAQLCRAVAAAVLGRPDRVRLVGFPDDGDAIAGLAHGTIALLAGTTPEATRAMRLHLRFSPALFIDGQSFLVPRRLHAGTASALHDRGICFLSGTPAETGLLEWASRAHLAFRADPYEEAGEMQAALIAGRCDAITASVSTLANMRAGFAGRGRDFAILPQMITIDPFALAVRDDDPAWATIVSIVTAALIEAEQDGITRTRLAAGHLAHDPAAARLLGPTPGLASLLGLADGWAARAIAAGGNYGEILAATTGLSTRLALPRGINGPWQSGGLIYAPAIP